MRRHAGRRTEAVANAFYEGPEGQSCRRIFYFIVCNIGTVDHDLLGYRIFQLLGNVSEPLDIIVDVTGCGASTDLPVSWMCRMLQMCPPSILSNVKVRHWPSEDCSERPTGHRHSRTDTCPI